MLTLAIGKRLELDIAFKHVAVFASVVLSVNHCRKTCKWRLKRIDVAHKVFDEMGIKACQVFFYWFHYGW